MRHILHLEDVDTLNFLEGHNTYIWVVDTSVKNVRQLIEKELSSDHISRCSLFISVGKDAEYYEQIVDDYIILSERDLFFPTIAEEDSRNLLSLVEGWQLSSTIFLQSDNVRIKKEMEGLV